MFLILVQSGLELFLYRTALIIVASMRLTDSAPGSRVAPIEPQIDMATARAMVKRNIEALFDGTHEWPMQLNSEPALGLALSYAYAMQQFVIAHEISHIYRSLKFATDPRWKAFLASRPDIASPWGEEFLADMDASTICGRLIPIVVQKGYMPQDVAEDVLFETPFIVFGLLEAMDKIAAAKGLVSGETHPPARLRRSNLLRFHKVRPVSRCYLDKAAERSLHIDLLTGLRRPVRARATR